MDLFLACSMFCFFSFCQWDRMIYSVYVFAPVLNITRHFTRVIYVVFQGFVTAQSNMFIMSNSLELCNSKLAFVTQFLLILICVFDCLFVFVTYHVVFYGDGNKGPVWNCLKNSFFIFLFCENKKTVWKLFTLLFLKIVFK